MILGAAALVRTLATTALAHLRAPNKLRKLVVKRKFAAATCTQHKQFVWRWEFHVKASQDIPRNIVACGPNAPRWGASVRHNYCGHLVRA